MAEPPPLPRFRESYFGIIAIISNRASRSLGRIAKYSGTMEVPKRVVSYGIFQAWLDVIVFPRCPFRPWVGHVEAELTAERAAKMRPWRLIPRR